MLEPRNRSAPNLAPMIHEVQQESVRFRDLQVGRAEFDWWSHMAVGERKFDLVDPPIRHLRDTTQAEPVPSLGNSTSLSVRLLGHD